MIYPRTGGIGTSIVSIDEDGSGGVIAKVAVVKKVKKGKAPAKAKKAKPPVLFWNKDQRRYLRERKRGTVLISVILDTQPFYQFALVMRI
jgi:hypothetical protein